MFLANNLDNEERYAQRRADGAQYGSADAGTPTWRELLPLLARAGINPSECFFTNIWVGLKAGRGSNTGAMDMGPGSESERWCEQFLCEQVREMRPRAVVALGEHAPVFLARVTDDLSAWRRWRSYRYLDARDAAVVLTSGFANTRRLRPCCCTRRTGARMSAWVRARTLRRCARCGRRSWQRMTRRAEQA